MVLSEIKLLVVAIVCLGVSPFLWGLPEECPECEKCPDPAAAINSFGASNTLLTQPVRDRDSGGMRLARVSENPGRGTVRCTTSRWKQ